mmetsp:Transcript_118013/g.280144  ORF Transcript_118013/g.280144 Transcript_118013/m.280144 type:complete len:303 (+) Transcript_118013:1549-2457(+)
MSARQDRTSRMCSSPVSSTSYLRKASRRRSASGPSVCCGGFRTFSSSPLSSSSPLYICFLMWFSLWTRWTRCDLRTMSLKATFLFFSAFTNLPALKTVPFGTSSAGSSCRLRPSASPISSRMALRSNRSFSVFLCLFLSSFQSMRLPLGAFLLPGPCACLRTGASTRSSPARATFGRSGVFSASSSATGGLLFCDLAISSRICRWSHLGKGGTADTCLDQPSAVCKASCGSRIHDIEGVGAVEDMALVAPALASGNTPGSQGLLRSSASAKPGQQNLPGASSLRVHLGELLLRSCAIDGSGF